MQWVRLIGSFIGQVISWGCIIAYIFGIPSPFDITDAQSWRGAMVPTPVVIALCVAGIVVTGPLLWTSTWWWPRVVAAMKAKPKQIPWNAPPERRFRLLYPQIRELADSTSPYDDAKLAALVVQMNALHILSSYQRGSVAQIPMHARYIIQEMPTGTGAGDAREP